MLIWLIGGLTAFCGALVYSELGATMPRSGGEYHFLSVIYHPFVGFLSGWASLIVGFAAPVALACMALSSYVCNIYPSINPTLLGMVVLVGITLLHAFSTNVGTKAQNVLTIAKILIITVFIIAGFCVSPDGASNFEPLKDYNTSDIFTSAFAVSLIWVYYAYSGWNAAAYIINDIKNPRKNVPLALLASTAFVIVLYILLNWIFLRTTPVAELSGQVEVGLISAKHIFGQNIGEFVGLLVALMLLSSISSMVYVGPRVGVSMGEDHHLFRFLTKQNKKGTPTAAVWTQFGISALLILTNSFKIVTQYTGVLISIFALLTVVGVFVHRHRFPEAERPYKTWAHPIPPILFGIVILWSVGYLTYDDYVQTFVEHNQSMMWTTLAGVITIAFGAILWFVDKAATPQKEIIETNKNKNEEI